MKLVFWKKGGKRKTGASKGVAQARRVGHWKTTREKIGLMICRTPRVFLSGGITSTFNQEQELVEKKAAGAHSFVLIKGTQHWMPSFASYLLEREKGSFAILLGREGIKDQKKRGTGLTSLFRKYFSLFLCVCHAVHYKTKTPFLFIVLLPFFSQWPKFLVMNNSSSIFFFFSVKKAPFGKRS